jgi:two-component system NtrC family sensor kinase
LLFQWPIKVKLMVGLGLLVAVVAILSSSGLYATYAYRELVKSLSWRVVELPVAARLSREVGDLRITLSELRGLSAAGFPQSESQMSPLRIHMIRDQFRIKLGAVEDTLGQYRDQLRHKLRGESRIADNQRERETAAAIQAALLRVHRADNEQDWTLDQSKVERLDDELEHLQALTAELPSHLHTKLGGFADEVRGQYRTLIVGTWVTIVAAMLMFALFVRLSWQWILVPLRVLIHGSRKVASGQFNHRIHLKTDDEMSELAAALNDMTTRFQDIRDDLDAQVRERTKQVVRSEQLASVGFLAAGVAHEINNPLASIAMCAESLQGRWRELLSTPVTADDDQQKEVIANYLKMIQEEAFRCKGITEKLLDFSRIGNVERENVDLTKLVNDVIEMVGHLGTYQGKRVEFKCREAVIADVNAQEIKQVVLNLLTNALDSLDAGGHVLIEVRKRGGMALLSFTDNGCGIKAELLDRVFEPFFTNRRAGQESGQESRQGTGLGLSITQRIIADHGGEIVAESAGPGRGATFRVELPLASTNKETGNQNKAA